MPFKKGITPWNKGKKMTTEYGLNISKSKVGKITKRTRKGPNNTIRCGMCKEYKSKDKFHENKRMIDGVDGRCKECRKKMNPIARIQRREQRRKARIKRVSVIVKDKDFEWAINNFL